MSALLIMIDISCNSVMHMLACTGVCVDLCHAEDGPLSVCVSLHGSAGLSLHALLTGQFLLRVKAAPLPALFSTVLHDGLLAPPAERSDTETDRCVCSVSFQTHIIRPVPYSCPGRWRFMVIISITVDTS